MKNLVGLEVSTTTIEGNGRQGWGGVFKPLTVKGS